MRRGINDSKFSVGDGGGGGVISDSPTDPYCLLCSLLYCLYQISYLISYLSNKAELLFAIAFEVFVETGGRKEIFFFYSPDFSSNSLAFHRILFHCRLPANMATAEYERTLPAGAVSRIAHNDDLQIRPEQQEMLTDPSSKFELLNPLGMHP